MFETVGALLSLLCTAERDAYRQFCWKILFSNKFFIDAKLVVEDLLYIASVCADKSRITDSTRLSLKCFCGSFSVISSYPALICDLPASSKPIDGSAILINLTGNERWQPFATQILKLLSKCLTEGTLFVERLVNASFVLSAFNLLCYGDADLHMACFDFAGVIVGVIDADIVPHEILIKSISSILSEDGEGISLFRNMVYDSSIGACLYALHSNCPDDVIKLTGVDVVNAFPHSVRSTKSHELKAALCSAYIRIAKTCPPHIWKPQSLVYMLCSPEPCFPLIDCFQVAVFLLGPDRVGGRTTKGCSTAPSTSIGSTSIGKGVQSSRVGEKRPVQDLETYRSKRQKVKEEILTSNDDDQVAGPGHFQE